MEVDTCCLLCYKQVSSKHLVGAFNHKLFHRFVTNLINRKVVNDYLGDAGDVVGVCDSCGTLLENYCTLYFQLECIQLKLEWEVEKLKDVMGHAGRVPSRVKDFKEICLQKGNGEKLARVISFRRKIYGKCSEKVKKKNPVVELRHLDNCPKIIVQKREIECDNDFIAVDRMKMDEDNLEADNGVMERQQETVATTISTDQKEQIDIVYESMLTMKNEEIDHFDENAFDDNGSEVSMEHLELEPNTPTENPISPTMLKTEEPKLQQVNDTIAHQSSVELLTNELDSKRLRAKFKCSKCSRTFSTKTKLTAHETDLICMDATSSDLDEDAKSKQLEKLNPRRKATKRHDTGDEDYIKSQDPQSCNSKSSSPENSGDEDDNDVKTDVNESSSSYPCSVEGCMSVFRKESFLDLHMKLHGDFTCNFCDFKTGMADSLFDHEWTSHSPKMGNNKIQCSRCPKIFSTVKARRTQSMHHYCGKHLGIEYTGGKKCPICGQGFAPDRVERRLRLHIKAMHDTTGKDPESIFHCDICNAPFLNDASCITHKIRVHAVSSSECSICHRKFKRQRLLTDHLRNNHQSASGTTNTNFPCLVPNCGKTFLAKFSLECHMRKHKEEMLMCSICGKRVMNANGLRLHMQKHNEGQKVKSDKRNCRAVCDLCGKGFYAKSQWSADQKLKIHLQSKMHSNDREEGLAGSWEFSCDVCGKLCQTQFKLEEHMRTHSKEKPFVCKVCGRDFSIKFNLKRHMKIVHKEVIPLERKRRRKSNNNEGDSVV